MIRISIVFLYFLYPTCNAQSGSSHPILLQVLGEKNFNGTQANKTYGRFDVFTDSIHANLNNPASYGFLKVTTYSVGSKL